MFRVLPAVYACLVAWLCSAFVHTVDRDVGGVAGLASPSVLVSVTVVAAVLLVPVLAARVAFARKRWGGMWFTVLAFAVGMGLAVAVAGFGGATVAKWWLAFAGMSALFALMIAATVLPTIWCERFRAVEAETAD